jgi:hypothetical protein
MIKKGNNMAEDREKVLEIMNMFFALRNLYERLHDRDPRHTCPEFGERIVMWEEEYEALD